MDDLQGDFGTSGETLQDMSPPGMCEGYMMKRRKWPLKGWHKVSKASKNLLGTIQYCQKMTSWNQKS